MKTGHSTRPTAALPWHALSPVEVASRLAVDLDTGLAANQVEQRVAEHGANEIKEHRARSPWKMFLDQFTDFMILVLIAAAIISGVIGEVVDTIAILVIVLLNGLLGFVQEYRAERAVAALKLLAAPSARVRRGDIILAVSLASQNRTVEPARGDIECVGHVRITGQFDLCVAATVIADKIAQRTTIVAGDHVGGRG